MIRYLKPFKTVEECLDILVMRGMVIPDRAYAARFVDRVGYYRLSAFYYPFRDFCPLPGEDGRMVRCDKFRPGTHFEDVRRFYLFDKEMRLTLADALERIEIALRSALVEVLGQISPQAHRDARTFKARFAEADDKGDVPLKQFCEGLDGHFARSKEEFAKHFRRSYTGTPPIWVEAGTWDWGKLTHIVANLADRHKIAIAARIHPDLPIKTLASWVTALNDLRNDCAHHSRIWNKPLVNSPGVPPAGIIPALDHLRGADGSRQDAPTKRLYSTLVVMVFLLRQFHPQSAWHKRLKEKILSADLPAEIPLISAGFPPGWDSQWIWR